MSTTEQQIRRQIALEIEEARRMDVSAWTNPDVRFGSDDAYKTAIHIALRGRAR